MELGCKFCFIRLRMNTPISRGELNWRRTKSETNNKYEDLTHDEDVHDKSIYNDDGFGILMMVNDGFKGGRNDDHENVNCNSETPQKLFGT